MTYCPNSFADKHLKDADERTALWRTLNSKDDIDMCIALAQTHMEWITKQGKAISPDDINRIEKDLAKLEIAMQRVTDFNEVLFGYGDEEKAQMLQIYNQLANRIPNL